jgi:uncharacterized membrane protein YhaH (DUF805 family)
MSAQPNAIQGNPYGAPRAAVHDAAEEFQPVRLFAVSGRIGRARYILYSIGFSMLVMFLAGFASAFMGAVGAVIMIVAWIAVVVVSIMLTIQRSHDFNMTGWFSLLGLVPLVNLIFWFIPGTDGDNRFGAKTPPNSTGVLIGIWIVPLIFVIGIAAAVAIPAYQQYVQRAAQVGK